MSRCSVQFESVAERNNYLNELPPSIEIRWTINGETGKLIDAASGVVVGYIYPYRVVWRDMREMWLYA